MGEQLRGQLGVNNGNLDWGSSSGEERYRQIQGGFFHVWSIELADKLCFKEKEKNSNLIPNLILI